MARGRPSRESVYARMEPAARDLQRLGGLPSPSESGAIWDDIWHLDAHNSTALEGNTLVLREVEELLDRGRAVGSKDLKDYLEVLGLRSSRTVGLLASADEGALAERFPDHDYRGSPNPC